MLNGRPIRNDDWESNGIIILDDLRNPRDRKLRAFAQFRAAYGLENKDFLKNVQIRAQLTKYIGEAKIYMGNI